MPGEDCLPLVICQVKPESREQFNVAFDGTRREMCQDSQYTLPAMSPPEVKPAEPTYWRTALDWHFTENTALKQ